MNFSYYKMTNACQYRSVIVTGILSSLLAQKDHSMNMANHVFGLMMARLSKMSAIPGKLLNYSYIKSFQWPVDCCDEK